MKTGLLSILFIFLSIGSFSQIIGKTTISDLHSELTVDADVEKFDVSYKEGGTIYKVLYKDGDRRDFCFYNNLLFCRKIYDKKETAQEKFDKLKTDGIIIQDGKIWKLKGFDGTETIGVFVSTDDFGRTWLAYLGLPKMN